MGSTLRSSGVWGTVVSDSLQLHVPIADHVQRGGVAYVRHGQEHETRLDPLQHQSEEGVRKE